MTKDLSLRHSQGLSRLGGLSSVSFSLTAETQRTLSDAESLSCSENHTISLICPPSFAYLFPQATILQERHLPLRLDRSEQERPHGCL